MLSWRIAFYRYGGLISRDDYGWRFLFFSRREVKRCIEALDWYIESFAEEMEARGLGAEVARYEDLLYRFMGVPDKNNRLAVKGRKQDRREERGW